MTKSAIRCLCAILALLLVSSGVACLAETERETQIDGYGNPTASSHTVYYTVYEYPIVDGERGSGKPVEDGSYTEPHEFEDGACVKCGYMPGEIEPPEPEPEPEPEPRPVFPMGDDDDDDDDAKTSAKAATEDTAEAEAPVAEGTFESASGVTVTKGTPAAEALKEVVAAIPADTEITVAGVAPEVADQLMDIIDNGGTQAELMELLKEFPVQTVDGVDCYVVTLSYTDAAGKPVTENYAFSTADGTLVKVF